MKPKRFLALTLRNIIFILIALGLVAGMATMGWRPTNRSSPAEFQVVDLVIFPAEVGVGGSATITVEIANTGESEGTHTAILKINGQEVEGGKAEVMVPARGTETVEFTLRSINLAGSYEIEIGGRSGTLKVTAAEEPTPEAIPLE